MLGELRPYAEYKPCHEWIGCAPSHWQIIPGFAAFREKQVKNTGMLVTDVLSLSYGRIVVKPPEKLHGLVPASFETYQIVEPGDVIIRPTDLQNDWHSIRVGLAKNRGIITSAYMCLKPTALYTPDYLHALLLSYDMLKFFYGMGSGLRQSLHYKDLKRFPMLLPPPAEQAEIVRFLGAVDRRVNRFIRAKRRLIEVLAEQKHAIITHAVTKGLNPHAPLKPSGIDRLGDVPEHWEVMAVKRVLRRLIDCEHKTAPAIDAGSAEEYRVVRTSAVRYGRLRLSGTYCTTAEAFAQWTERGLPEAGDVIFTREAPAGEACVVPAEYRVCLGQRTVLMKLRRDRYNPAYLIHMIYAGPPSHRIRIASQGSTVGHFNMDDIADMQVYVPPLREQVAIVAWISDHTKELDLAMAQAEREIDLIREYRTRLVADVVTGKIDVRDIPVPNDAEPMEPDVDAVAAEEVTEDDEPALEAADAD